MGKPLNTANDFWSKVQHQPGPGCWLWMGQRQWQGYGRIRWHGKKVQAHRLAYFLIHGRWPKHNAYHTCDNPPCVRPAHLFDGTQRDNLLDASRKGRISRRGNPKITTTDAIAIRQSAGTLITIAARFGLKKSMISKIRRGEAWKESA